MRCHGYSFDTDNMELQSILFDDVFQKSTLACLLACLLFNRMFVGMWVGLSVKNYLVCCTVNSANHDLHDLKQNLTIVQTADVLSKWLKESPAVSVLNKILSFLGFRRYSFIFKKNACLWFVCMCSNIVYQRHNWG